MSSSMGNYKCGRRWRRIKGFRLNSSRFCVHRLRIQFLAFMRLLKRWKSSYSRALKSLKKGIINGSRGSSSGSICTRSLIDREEGGQFCSDYKLNYSHARSNSFYAEAIAECLEFIKSSSVSPLEKDPVASL